MKFLCPSCKAKYQIADEKVAGRSVRMKCRKCGQEIRVSSAEAIARSDAPPKAAVPAEPGKQQAPQPPGTEEPLKVDKQVLLQRSGAVDKVAPKPAPPRAPMKRVGGAPPPPGSAKPAAPAPRPPPRPSSTLGVTHGGLSRPLPRPAPGTGAAPGPVATSFDPARAHPARTTAAFAARAPAKAVPEVNREVDLPIEAFFPPPVNEEYDDEEQTRIAGPGALAGAFNRAVAAPTAHSVSDPLTMAGDEWFVGINGVPVGPIHLGELRSKSASGSITKESLVWRDGFEEWRPLRSFPELAAIVEESVSYSASMVPPATERRAGLSGLDALSDPFARPAPELRRGSQQPASGGTVVTGDAEIAGLGPGRKTWRAAWLAVFAALLFGLTVGFVLFSQKPQEVVRYVTVPAKSQNPSVLRAPTADSAAVADEVSVKGVRPGGKAVGTKPQAVTPKPEEGQNKLAGGLRGLGAGVPGGPNAPASQSGSASGGQLEAAQLQQVVSRYKTSVQRSCWQPALDTRDKDAPSSARVEVSIQVGPTGSVQSVSTKGDPRGYRGLANCIAGRVRGWQFPASGSSTEVNVPFMFVVQ